MAIRLRNVIRKAGYGLAFCVSTGVNRLQAAPAGSPVDHASMRNMALFDDMIEQAMRDGSVSLEERKLIIGVARRKMAAADVAEAEARLATLLTAPVRAVTNNNSPMAAAAMTRSPTSSGTCQLVLRITRLATLSAEQSRAAAGCRSCQ
jgi:hypothetical protein